VSIVEIQLDDAAVRAELEEEKRRNEGEFWPPATLFFSWIFRGLICYLFLCCRSTEGTKRNLADMEALQVAYDKIQCQL
jgi:hypothetical protein